MTAQSKADATPIPESRRDILEKKGFAHIATIGPNGVPQSSPVWYGWDGTQLKFSTTKARQKYKNLVRNPRVSASILDPDDPTKSIAVVPSPPADAPPSDDTPADPPPA